MMAACPAMKPSVIVRLILPVLWQSFSASAVQTEVCGAAVMSPCCRILCKAKRTQDSSSPSMLTEMNTYV